MNAAQPRRRRRQRVSRNLALLAQVLQTALDQLRAGGMLS